MFVFQFPLPSLVEPRHKDPLKILHFLWHAFTRPVEVYRISTWYSLVMYLLWLTEELISLRFLGKYEPVINVISLALFSLTQYYGEQTLAGLLVDRLLLLVMIMMPLLMSMVWFLSIKYAPFFRTP